MDVDMIKRNKNTSVDGEKIECLKGFEKMCPRIKEMQRKSSSHNIPMNACGRGKAQKEY